MEGYLAPFFYFCTIFPRVIFNPLLAPCYYSLKLKLENKVTDRKTFKSE